MAADLKIQLVFSAVGRPRGRGKIERFFKSLGQKFLSRLPGYCPSESKARDVGLTLPQLAERLERYLVEEYHATPHSTTGEPPQARWEAGGFLPQMPESLEQLDLLLLTVARSRHVHQDGIRFMGLRYISPTLAAYIGEEVLLRYDPRDLAEVRVFHRDRFLCRAICQELAGETLSLKDIVRARNSHRQQLRRSIQERQKTVDSLLGARRWEIPEEQVPTVKGKAPKPKGPKLKRYRNE